MREGGRGSGKEGREGGREGGELEMKREEDKSQRGVEGMEGEGGRERLAQQIADESAHSSTHTHANTRNQASDRAKSALFGLMLHYLLLAMCSRHTGLGAALSAEGGGEGGGGGTGGGGGGGGGVDDGAELWRAGADAFLATARTGLYSFRKCFCFPFLVLLCWTLARNTGKWEVVVNGDEREGGEGAKAGLSMCRN